MRRTLFTNTSNVVKPNFIDEHICETFINYITGAAEVCRAVVKYRLVENTQLM